MKIAIFFDAHKCVGMYVMVSLYNICIVLNKMMGQRNMANETYVELNMEILIMPHSRQEQAIVLT